MGTENIHKTRSMSNIIDDLKLALNALEQQTDALFEEKNAALDSKKKLGESKDSEIEIWKRRNIELKYNVMEKDVENKRLQKMLTVSKIIIAVVLGFAIFNLF